MNALNKVIAWAKGIGRAILNRYESAWQRWGERSWLPQTYQDARLDADASTRIELQRRSRYWVKNSDTVQRIRSLHVQFGVGTNGLQVVPNSDDETWNHAKQHNWEAWGRAPALDNDLSLGEHCLLWAGQLFDDGEFLIHKTWDTSSGKRVPAIRTYAANRCGTPPKYSKEEGKTIFDGKKLDKFGKPVLYYIRDDAGDYTPIPADEIIHKYKMREPGMVRGIPEGFSVLNILHDFEDLHMLEMQAAKLAAELAVVETNATGEFDSTATRRSRVNVSTPNVASQTVLKNADSIYRLMIGAKRYALRAGDSIKNFQVDRPSIVQQEYWLFLAGRICNGYNVPRLLVFPYSLQGTVVRMDVDVCGGAFRANFEVIASALRELYAWQTAWAIKYDRSLDGSEPNNCLECIIRPPRPPNADIGYTAQALAIELGLGTKTLQDVFAERQQDWRHQMRQAAEAVFFKKKLAKEFSSKEEGIEVLPDEISKTVEIQLKPEPDGDEANEGEGDKKKDKEKQSA